MRSVARTHRLATLVAVAAVVALLAPSAALGYSSTGTSYPLIVVDNGSGAQQEPRADGNFAAYSDDSGSSRIEFFNFSTSTTGSIPSASGAIDSLSDINGDTIVFTRVSSAGSSIFRYSISAGTSSEVAPYAAPAIPIRRNPTIGGPAIVWEDEGISSTGDPELVVATGSTTFQLTNDALADRNPNLSPTGGRVVWEKCNSTSATCDVNSAAGAGTSWVTTPVATSGANEIWPDTNGTQIVYASDAGGNYHVYVTTLGGTPTQLVVPGSLSENHPAISGSFVSFESSNGTQTDIYVYDLATSTVRRITNTPVSETLSDITSTVSGVTTTVTVIWLVIEADANVYASQFQTIAVPATLVLSPPADTNPVGTSHTVTATVKDAGGKPFPNLVVRFTVTGSVNTFGFCTTDSNGQCSFTYTGPSLPGADEISAYADTDGDGVQDTDEPVAVPVTKAWVLPTSTAGQASGGGHIADAIWGRVAFGFSAKSKDGSFHGQCNVIDPGNRMIKCLDVTSLVITGNQATIYGNATDNGTATTYVMKVADNADPGKGADTFSIQTASGYSASGTLTAGNVQVQP